MTGDKSTIVMRSVGMYHDQKPACETVELPDIGQVSIWLDRLRVTVA